MKKNTITYIVIALLVVVGAYWAYGMFAGGSSDTSVGGVTVAGPDNFGGPIDETTLQANQFIQILQNVDQVTLDNRSLLTSPIFQTGLQDFGQPIADRPTGRSNPFSPVTGLESVPVKSPASTTSTNLFTQ